MAYRKVCDAQGGPQDGEVLCCSGDLDLDWDLDKEELQESRPNIDHMQMQHVDYQKSGKRLMSINNIVKILTMYATVLLAAENLNKTQRNGLTGQCKVYRANM